MRKLPGLLVRGDLCISIVMPHFGIWRVTGLTIVDDYRIQIELEDDVFGHVDLRQDIQGRNIVALRDWQEFRAAKIDHDGVIVWPCGEALDPTQLFLRLKLQQFVVGTEFVMSGAHWRCTDVGTRTVVAIKLERDEDPSWYSGPPYALAETVIDEYDLSACELLPAHLQAARERMLGEELQVCAPQHRGSKPLMRRREEIRHPIVFVGGPHRLVRLIRGEQRIERATLEELERHHSVAAEVLTRSKFSAAFMDRLHALFDDY